MSSLYRYFKCKNKFVKNCHCPHNMQKHGTSTRLFLLNLKKCKTFVKYCHCPHYMHSEEHRGDNFCKISKKKFMRGIVKTRKKFICLIEFGETLKQPSHPDAVQVKL